MPLVQATVVLGPRSQKRFSNDAAAICVATMKVGRDRQSVMLKTTIWKIEMLNGKFPWGLRPQTTDPLYLTGPSPTIRLLRWLNDDSLSLLAENFGIRINEWLL